MHDDHRTGTPVSPAPAGHPEVRAFLAALRHELRGPLTALLAAAEVLEASTGQEPEAREAREVVRRQAQRLSFLLDELTRRPIDDRLAEPALRPPRLVLLIASDERRGAWQAALQHAPEASEIYTAGDGITGLRRLLELEPDLSLIELDLDGLTGHEVARHARAAGHAGRLVALVAPRQTPEPRRIAASGFDDWIAHADEAAQLLAKLDRYDGF